MICGANWRGLISPQTWAETMSVSLQGTGAISHQRGEEAWGSVYLQSGLLWPGQLCEPESVCSSTFHRVQAQTQDGKNDCVFIRSHTA